MRSQRKCRSLQEPEPLTWTSWILWWVKLAFQLSISPFLRSLHNHSFSHRQNRDALALGLHDRQSTASVSIYVYYTPQFRNRVSDPRGHIRNLIDVTNTAFSNTGIALRLTEFCIEELNTGESSNYNQRLVDFSRAKGTVSNLLNTADIAILMTSQGVGQKNIL